MVRFQERDQLDSAMLNALSKGGVFYSEGYGRYLKSLGDQPLYMFDDNFVMLVLIKNRWPFRFARLPVEFIRYSEEGQPEGRRFLDECIDCCRNVLKLQWIQHPETTARFQETPSRCVRIPYGNHIIDTTRSEDEIWSDLKSSTRKKIRKARSCGVEYKSGGIELLKDFHAIYVQTAERSGFKPLPAAFFENQFIYFGDLIRIGLVYHCESIQGGMVCYYDSHMCYCMYAGSAPSSVVGAGNILYWELMQDAISSAVEKYSLVGARINPAPGSKYEGINFFKSSMTPHLEPCYLFKVALNPKMYKLYRILDQMRAYLKKEKPPQDIIDQELSQWLDINDPQSLYEVYGKSWRRFILPISDAAID